MDDLGSGPPARGVRDRSRNQLEGRGVDFRLAIDLLQPQTAQNLRKLALWAAGEAQRATHGPTRLSAEVIAQRFSEEADWIDFQAGCRENDGAALLSRRKLVD